MGCALSWRTFKALSQPLNYAYTLVTVAHKTLSFGRKQHRRIDLEN
jgi:hypothetical protein